MAAVGVVVAVVASAAVVSAGEANAVLVVDLRQQVTLGQNIGRLVHNIICRSIF